MDHQFIWDTLEKAGIPMHFILAILALHHQNKHFIKMQGRFYHGPEVFSGVRQGCPLSAIIFAICADVLLIRVQRALKNDEIVKVFADDTAVVIHDYAVSVPTLAFIFKEFEQISGLALNMKKTTFIPMWPIGDTKSFRNLFTETCPLWKEVRIDMKAKYLGFQIGPGAGTSTWSAPITK